MNSFNFWSIDKINTTMKDILVYYINPSFLQHKQKEFCWTCFLQTLEVALP